MSSSTLSLFRHLKPATVHVHVQETNIRIASALTSASASSASDIFSCGNNRSLPVSTNRNRLLVRHRASIHRQSALFTSPQLVGLAATTSLALPHRIVRMDSTKALQSPPIIRTASPAPLAQDFARQQVSKQQRSNFHSSSISADIYNKMVSQSVNKTNLHPTGVQYVQSSKLFV